jgi:hypothetical protein
VDQKYLDETAPVTLSYYLDGVRTRNYKRRNLFIYPDYMDGWFSNTYHSDLFFNFIDRHKLLEEFYTTPEELGYINFWIAKAYEIEPSQRDQAFDNQFPLSDEVLKRILAIRETHPLGKYLDQNLVCLMLANRAFGRNDEEGGMNYYHRFNKDNFAASRDKYEYLEKTFFLNQLKDLCMNLALAGKQREAAELAEKFEENYEKAYAYISMAEKLYLKKTDPTAFVYIDSVFSKSKDIDFSQFNFGRSQELDFRFNLILLLSRIGGRQLNAFADNFLSGIIEQHKTDGVMNRVYGIAEEGNFYRAMMAMPSTLTETDELFAQSIIIWQACRKKESEAGRKQWKAMDDFITHDYNYIFFKPN